MTKKKAKKNPPADKKKKKIGRKITQDEIEHLERINDDRELRDL